MGNFFWRKNDKVNGNKEFEMFQEGGGGGLGLRLLLADIGCECFCVLLRVVFVVVAQLEDLLQF